MVYCRAQLDGWNREKNHSENLRHKESFRLTPRSVHIVFKTKAHKRFKLKIMRVCSYFRLKHEKTWNWISSSSANRWVEKVNFVAFAIETVRSAICGNRVWSHYNIYEVSQKRFLQLQHFVHLVYANTGCTTLIHIAWAKDERPIYFHINYILFVV